MSLDDTPPGCGGDAARVLTIDLEELTWALNSRDSLAESSHWLYSHDLQAALKGYGMRSSMSRKGNCWDNAPAESLWGSLKVGRLYGKRFATRREAMDEVIDWLTFYNHRRLHSTLGYVSPMKFEANWRAGQLNKAA